MTDSQIIIIIILQLLLFLFFIFFNTLGSKDPEG